MSSAVFFLKKNLSGIPSVSSRSHPDQAPHYVSPDLGPNCLQGYQQTTLVGKELKYLAWK